MHTAVLCWRPLLAPLHGSEKVWTVPTIWCIIVCVVFWTLVQDCLVNKTLSSLLCLSPSLNGFTANHHALSFPIHFEMSSDDITSQTLRFHADFQNLQNFTYVTDPVFFPFPEESRLRTFFTDESHLVLEVSDWFSHVQRVTTDTSVALFSWPLPHGQLLHNPFAPT